VIVLTGAISGKARPWDLTHYVHMGQSLAVGYLSGTVLSTSQPYSNLMLHDSSGTYDITNPNAATLSLVPLVAPVRPVPGGGPTGYPTNIGGESPEVSFANQLTALSIARGQGSRRIVTTNVGYSGQPYSVIRKGGTSNSYAAALYEIRAIARLVALMGLTYGVGGLLLTHGESDSTNLQYGADILQLAQDFQGDVRAILGQAVPVPLYLSQQNSFPFQVAGPGVNISSRLQLAAGFTNPRQTVFALPKYQYPYGSDNVHLINIGYIGYGEKLAINVDRYEQGKWQGTLQPVSFTRAGAVVTIGCNVPYPPMVFDSGHTGPHQSGTYAAWALGNGLEARDDAGLITINSVAIVSNTLVVTMARTPTTNLIISNADTGEPPIAGAGFAVGQGGRCSLIRDSDPAVGRSAQSGNVYANWLPEFVQAVA
jgi:hypothetical protein